MLKNRSKVLNIGHLELRNLANDVTGGPFGYLKPNVSLEHVVK